MKRTLTRSFLLLWLVVSVPTTWSVPIPLEYDNHPTQFVVEFPSPPEAQTLPHGALPETDINWYAVEDTENQMFFNVTIYRLDERLGQVTNEVAQLMVSQAINTQNALVDNNTGSKATVIQESKEPFEGMISQAMQTQRDLGVVVYGAYRAVYHQRYLVTLWASGVDSPGNRRSAIQFVSSLDLR